MKPMPIVILISLAAALFPGGARAHCDTQDGPVASVARAALASGRLAPVLAWVRDADEAEIRQAFAKARAVRKGGEAARALADRWFLETVVRVHRAGEGAPYTGLAAAGAQDPAVAAADRLLAGGEAAALEELLVRSVREGLHRHLAALRRESPPGDDVAAGRRWVAAYVPFVHWAEGVNAAAGAGAGHEQVREAAAEAPRGHAGHGR